MCRKLALCVCVCVTVREQANTHTHTHGATVTAPFYFPLDPSGVSVSDFTTRATSSQLHHGNFLHLHGVGLRVVSNTLSPRTSADQVLDLTELKIKYWRRSLKRVNWGVQEEVCFEDDGEISLPIWRSCGLRVLNPKTGTDLQNTT